MMFVIKNAVTGKYAKQTGANSSYPWKMVSGVEEATEYKTSTHANEIAFWHLDHTEKWLIESKVTGNIYKLKQGKYLPV
jgi:hypothetical protein